MRGLLTAEHGLQGAWASAVAACGLGSCGSQVLERGVNNCATWAQPPRGECDLQDQGPNPGSPVLAGRLPITESAGKPLFPYSLMV